MHCFVLFLPPFCQVNAITKLDTGELMALKRMEKYAVLQSSSHLKMVWVERKIMSLTSSPFLCNLLYAFESDKELFLVMPFMQGGDLRFHLKERGTMPVQTAQFYASVFRTHTHAHAPEDGDTRRARRSRRPGERLSERTARIGGWGAMVSFSKFLPHTLFLSLLVQCLLQRGDDPGTAGDAREARRVQRCGTGSRERANGSLRPPLRPDRRHSTHSLSLSQLASASSFSESDSCSVSCVSQT